MHFRSEEYFRIFHIRHFLEGASKVKKIYTEKLLRKTSMSESNLKKQEVRTAAATFHVYTRRYMDIFNSIYWVIFIWFQTIWFTMSEYFWLTVVKILNGRSIQNYRLLFCTYEYHWLDFDSCYYKLLLDVKYWVNFWKSL